MSAQIDPKELRRALGCFPTGVAVVTTVDAHRSPVGLTVNSFSSVSLEPPLVLWSLRNSSSCMDVFRGASGFAVNILTDGQDALSAYFGSSGNVRRFEGKPYTLGVLGMPLLNDCLASFECSIFAQHQAGDHVIFIGRIEQFEYGQERDPLVFHNGAYVMLTQSLRVLLKRGVVRPDTLTEARGEVYAMALRMACQKGTGADFDRIEANLRVMEALANGGDMLNRGKAGIEFFSLITAAAHNEVIGIVTQWINALLGQTLLDRVAQDVQGSHRQELMPIRHEILRCLRARNPGEAIRAVGEYLLLAGPGVEIKNADKVVAP